MAAAATEKQPAAAPRQETKAEEDARFEDLIAGAEAEAKKRQYIEWANATPEERLERINAEAYGRFEFSCWEEERRAKNVLDAHVAKAHLTALRWKDLIEICWPAVYERHPKRTDKRHTTLRRLLQKRGHWLTERTLLSNDLPGVRKLGFCLLPD